MAVFEKKKATKVNLDDTIPLTCTVESAEKQADHMVYLVKIKRGLLKENTWLDRKRYSDFATLDTELRISNVELPLPPKKVFGNFDREFIAERQQGLQKFIDEVLGHHLLANSLYVKRFLDASNYSINIPELALQHVSMIFRSEKGWDVIEPLSNFGWRLRKTYILVKPVDQPKQRHLLSWTDFGPDKTIPDKELGAIMKILSSIQHPNIFPVIFSTCSESGGMLIQSFNDKGTLRDSICKCKPKGHYLKKYACPNSKTWVSFDQNAIKIIGKQILDTLKFLHDKGLPYGHLHAGNIIIDGGECKLLDIGNWLLGIPSYYRSFYCQFKKINTVELTDVYCFGQLLYEMAFGRQLNAPTCDEFPPTSPPQIRSVLESILTYEACKNGLPSIIDLLSHPLFSDVTLNAKEKPTMKIPSKLKEVIKNAKDEFEKRLKEEQKIIHQIQRISRAKQFHMSEEEKKKRRKSKKKALENGETEPAPSSSSQTTKSSDSSSSQSKAPATSAVPPPPPPSAPPPPPPPPPPTSSEVPAPPPPPPVASGSSSNRGALLSSITGFSKSGLKKAVTKDRSGPKI